jgi:hypothetical protein
MAVYVEGYVEGLRVLFRWNPDPPPPPESDIMRSDMVLSTHMPPLNEIHITN